MAADNHLVQKVLPSMQQAQKTAADSLFNEGVRTWLNFSDIAKVGKFDFAQLHTQLFPREEVNAQCARLRADSAATVKDYATARISGDYLGAMERDFRMRQRSRIRLFVHAGNRARSNSREIGPLLDNSTGWLKELFGDQLVGIA